MESNTESIKQDSVNGKEWVPARFVFILIAVLGTLVSGIATMCMPIAIVGMVISANDSSAEDSISDACPVNGDSNTTISSNDTQEDGEFEWSILTQSYILAAPSYGKLVSIIIGARIADLTGHKMVLLILSIIGALLTVITPVIARWSVEALIVLQVLQGIVSGPGIPVQYAMLTTWIPVQERTQMGSILTAAAPLSAVLSMILTGKLMATFNWEFIFYLYGGLVLLWCLLWMFFVYDSPNTHPRISDREKEYILANTKKETKVVLPAPWWKILTSLPVWSYAICGFGNSWTINIMLSEIPTYMKTFLHYDLESTGYLSSLPHIFSWLGNICHGFLSHWLRTKYMSQMTTYIIFNALATIGPAAAFIAITQVGCDSVAIICFLMVTMFLNAAIIGGSYLNHMDIGVNFTGPLNGIFTTLGTVTAVVTPSFTAAITDNNNTLTGWGLVFYISAGISVIPFIIFLVFGSVKEQEWNKPTVKLSEDSEKDQ